MRYFAIALLLVVPLGGDAEAQRPNRARQNLDRILERTLDQQRDDDRRSQPPRQRADDDRRDRRDRDRDRDHNDRWPQTHRPGFRSQRFRHQMPFGSYYAVPYAGYGFGVYAPSQAEEEYYARTTPPPPQPSVTTGFLRLEITPASGLSFYVDGIFVGSSSNLGTQFELNAGARRVEVRAPGYKPLVIDVRIVEGQVTTFRGALESLTPQLPPPQATGSRTMYIIPGCYVGNSRPSAEGLRAGCDINKLITK